MNALQNNIVYKSNELINARYSAMSLNEQLLILSAISQVDPRTLTGAEAVEVSVSAFKDLAGVNHSMIYNDLKSAASRLLRRAVTVENPSVGIKALETTWISGIEYLEGEAAIRLYFAPKILPYLSQLSGNFTQYKLQYVSKFKSKYAIRLYELLIQWQCTGEREITIEEFRNMFGLNGKYKSIKDLKLSVLTPAISDINEHSNMTVEVGQRKCGKSIAAFQFKFKIKKKTKKNNRLTKKYVSENARPGETWEQAKFRLEQEILESNGQQRIGK